MNWIKFKDEMPPEPKKSKDELIPVLIGINTEREVHFDLIYWEKRCSKWALNYAVSFMSRELYYDLDELSWFSCPLSDLETEEEA